MSDDPDKPFTFSRRGILFIISAPSGAGKTTLSHQLLHHTPNLRLSISYTTRQPRQGEADGRDYHFIDERRFFQMRETQAFAEWAQVHESYYGTAKAPLDEAVAQGYDFLLDIDVQGAKQLQSQYTEAVSVFVLPPSWAELERRLRSRGTDSEAAITRRLRRAREEAQELKYYDYWVINTHVEQAVASLSAIIVAERARVSHLRAGTTP